MRDVQFEDLGLRSYKEVWDYQEKLFSAIIDQKVKNRKLPDEDKIETTDHLLFVEHPHVYTLGKSGHMENLLIDQTKMNDEHIEFFKINRGGDITYHGPGQVVGYPIFNLDHYFTDIHKYLRYLEEAIILTLAEYGIEAGRSKGETGVWLDVDKPTARKICAMGIKSSRWITMHGFAFNINTDLKYFDLINPCGFTDKGVTSIKMELGKEQDFQFVMIDYIKSFIDTFGLELISKKIHEEVI